MNDQIIPVSFHGDTLVLADHDGEPFVAMKPVVDNMGLDWKSQHTKLSEKFGSTMVEITIVAEDGKQRGMSCLSLRKFPAWLYSINPSKVATELQWRGVESVSTPSGEQEMLTLTEEGDHGQPRVSAC